MGALLKPLTSAEIMDLLTRLNDGGKTVIMVTHEEDIAAYARRVIRMRDGQVVSDTRQGALVGPPPRYGIDVETLAQVHAS